MKGLVVKDLYVLKQQWKLYVAVVALWAAMSYLSKDATFFMGVVSVFAAMLPITAYSYDERAKWDKYCLSMPVSRTALALSKYVLAVIITATGSLIALAFCAAIGALTAETLAVCAIIAAVSLAAFSLIMPLIYKVGAEKGRMAMIIMFILPAVVFSSLPEGASLPAWVLANPILLSVAVSAVIFTLSASISVSIYKRKEI